MNRFAAEFPDDWQDRLDYVLGEPGLDHWERVQPEAPIPPQGQADLTVELRCICGFPFAPWERACSQCGHTVTA